MESIPSNEPSDLTLLLRKVNDGDALAQEEFFRRVHGELRRLAQGAMKHERYGHTLQPTALVHEAFLRLFGRNQVAWVDRGHFFKVAGTTMRRVLIDYARSFKAKKNWGGQRVELTNSLVFTEEKAGALLALEEALARLELREPRQCRIVELRYFAGLTEEETAAALGISARTVKRDWKLARAWLHGEIVVENEAEA